MILGHVQETPFLKYNISPTKREVMNNFKELLLMDIQQQGDTKIIFELLKV